MGVLDTKLGEAERIYREMRGLAETGDAESKGQIVKLRSRYAMLMLDVLQALKGDTRLQEDVTLKGDFERRFFEVRQKLAEHQAKWRLQAIEDDPTGYMRSASGLNSVQEDFYRWVGATFALR